MPPEMICAQALPAWAQMAITSLCSVAATLAGVLSADRALAARHRRRARAALDAWARPRDGESDRERPS